MRARAQLGEEWRVSVAGPASSRGLVGGASSAIAPRRRRAVGGWRHAGRVGLGPARRVNAVIMLLFIPSHSCVCNTSSQSNCQASNTQQAAGRRAPPHRRSTTLRSHGVVGKGGRGVSGKQGGVRAHAQVEGRVCVGGGGLIDLGGRNLVTVHDSRVANKASSWAGGVGWGAGGRGVGSWCVCGGCHPRPHARIVRLCRGAACVHMCMGGGARVCASERRLGEFSGRREAGLI